MYNKLINFLHERYTKGVKNVKLFPIGLCEAKYYKRKYNGRTWIK